MLAVTLTILAIFVYMTNEILYKKYNQLPFPIVIKYALVYIGIFDFNFFIFVLLFNDILLSYKLSVVICLLILSMGALLLLLSSKNDNNYIQNELFSTYKSIPIVCIITCSTFIVGIILYSAIIARTEGWVFWPLLLLIFFLGTLLFAAFYSVTAILTKKTNYIFTIINCLIILTCVYLADMIHSALFLVVPIIIIIGMVFLRLINFSALTNKVNSF